MKGDFTKLSFDPTRRHSRVYQQQGRVQLDSDFNAFVDIITHRIRQGTIDLIGPHAGPVNEAGFLISPANLLTFEDKTHLVVEGAETLTYPNSQPLTLEARIKVNSESASLGGTLLSTHQETKYQTPEHKDATPTEQGYYLEVDAQGKLRFVRMETVGEEKVEELVVCSTSSIRFDRFTHVAVTFDGSVVKLFIDGRAVGRGPSRGAALTSSTTLYFGARILDGQPAYFFEGTMEEVRFWNTARQPEAIISTMNISYSEDFPNELIAYWPLNTAETSSDDRVTEIKALVGDLTARAPSEKPLTWAPNSLKIESGRYYVDGILCQNKDAFTYANQPDLPDSVLPGNFGEGSQWLAYLDVWEQLITRMDDPDIAEVALGNTDTTVRTKVRQQIKLLELESIDEADAAWQHFLEQQQVTGRMLATFEANANPPGNQLYRVEIHNSGYVLGDYGKTRNPDHSVEITKVDGNIVTLATPNPELAALLKLNQLVEVFDPTEETEDRQSGLFQITAIDKNRYTLDAGQSSENQARYLTKDAYLRPIASFKWSRNNASQDWAVHQIAPNATDPNAVTGGTISLSSFDSLTSEVKPGDWVELTDTPRILACNPGIMLQVESIPTSSQLNVKGYIPASLVESSSDKRVIPWNQRSPMWGVDQVTSEWVMLENGIRVTFDSENLLTPGSYWMIPARSDLAGGIIWPRDAGSGAPLYREPDGIDHHFAPLATIAFQGKQPQINDLRTRYNLPGKTPSKSTGKSTTKQPRPTTRKPRDTPKGNGKTTVKVPTAPVSQPPDLRTPSGTIPSGYSILAPTPVPPDGFHRTGLRIKAEPWTQLVAPPDEALSAHLVTCAFADNKFLAFYDDATVWVLDPQEEAWEQRTPMEQPRTGFAVATIEGRVHVVGGRDELGNKLATHEVYDVANDFWDSAPPMPTPRDGLVLAHACDCLFAIGGETRRRTVFSGVCDINEFYNPLDGTWERANPIPTARAGASVAVLDHQIHVLGGTARVLLGGSRCLDSHEVYEPQTGTWSAARDLPGHFHYLQAVNGRQQIHLFGGSSTQTTTEHHVFNKERNRYTRHEDLPEMPIHRGSAGDLERIYLLDGDSTYLHVYVRDSILYVHRKD